MNILEYIPTGSSHSVSRRDLCRMTGQSDRCVRKEIHKARRTTPILNLSDGDGYFIPDLDDDTDKALLKHFVKQEESRLKSIGWSLKSARAALRSCESEE